MWKYGNGLYCPSLFYCANLIEMFLIAREILMLCNNKNVERYLFGVSSENRSDSYDPNLCKPPFLLSPKLHKETDSTIYRNGGICIKTVYKIIFIGYPQSLPCIWQ